jgi:undecaprenyl-diphosphatase
MLIGATRIYLGVHWASDVFAGWSLGAAWAMACWLLEWWIEKKVEPARKNYRVGTGCSPR